VTLDPQVTARLFYEPNMTQSGQLSDLQAFPDFTNNEPCWVGPWCRIEQPSTNGPVGEQILGYLQPTETANYTFYIGSDGQSALYLSTDATPAHAVEICNQPNYDDVREWISDEYHHDGNLSAPEDPAKVSSPIPLVAGQKYFLQVLYMGPGDGNKNVSVTWTDDGAQYPVPSPLSALDGTTPQSLGLQPYYGATTIWRISTSAGAGGSITPNASTTLVSNGQNQTFTINPSPGYIVNGVTVDGVVVGAVSSYTFTNVTALHSISATFTSLAPSFNPVTIESGALVLVTGTQVGYNYYLLQATNLTPPVVWTTNSVTAGTGGNITNTPAISRGQRAMFYRYMVQ
jgi:hypothetical protein